MLKRRSRGEQTEAVLRVDRLLAQLRSVMRHEPPADLRARLARMSLERPGEDRSAGNPHGSLRGRRIAMASAVGLMAGVLLAGAACIGFLAHEESQGSNAKRAALQKPAAPAAPVPVHAKVGERGIPSQRRSRAAHAGNDAEQGGNLVIPLPYSDRAIQAGTGTMIGVSLSQDELLSLGFPVTPTMDDRRFTAEMILGDDGLPQAIRVPLPLRTIEERK